ncbi:MAG: ArsJ-associated glyceraldehyde-3-phosphate dehydrogenase [Proteobacteria bacterium]|nr:ArsJ-associated glyceraldehyde-3-phosphate dehydrogenase [Pseudomonadota bacterium]
MKIGINGMGRIGRLVLRAALGGVLRDAKDKNAGARLEIVHLNEISGGTETTAHLLEFDSIHGRWNADIKHDENTITVDGHSMSFTSVKNPQDHDWSAHGCDLILECTGKFRTPEKLYGYFAKGAQKVLVASPVQDNSALNIVYGINDHLYNPKIHHIITAASCTTNCLAPMVKVMHECIGIRHGQITTIHDPTNTNVIVDAPHKDLRRARSAMNSLMPTTTGSATAIGLIYPDLQGKLNGHAVRAPVLNASLTDAVFEMKQSTSIDEVNSLFAEAAENELAGIMGYEERPLVSADYVNDTRSAIIDAKSTLVTNGTMLKVYAWYDNEMGYACRMVDLARKIIDQHQ